MLMATVEKRWTLAEVHSLPDDGNKYELVRGELFVTPPPTYTHESIGARLAALVIPYVMREGLGLAFQGHAVMRYDGSEVGPDLMVRAEHRGPDAGWDNAPVPILIVETASPSTRRRDREQKRSLYLDAGVAEYWMIDPERRCVTVVRRDEADVVVTRELVWHPAGARDALMIQVERLFD
jgi:Uma2 family endonuclease